MTVLNKTRIRSRNRKDWEVALLLNVRFQVLLDEKNTDRLCAAIEAFESHVNSAGCSEWLLENYVDAVSDFAGLFISFTGAPRHRNLVVSLVPFELENNRARISA